MYVTTYLQLKTQLHAFFIGDSANAGNYRVKAKNKWGECESSAELTVVLRPEIEGLEDVSAVPGEAVQFTCIIRANPLPEVTW